jgi:hypothetical protein
MSSCKLSIDTEGYQQRVSEVEKKIPLHMKRTYMILCHLTNEFLERIISNTSVICYSHYSLEFIRKKEK